MKRDYKKLRQQSLDIIRARRIDDEPWDDLYSEYAMAHLSVDKDVDEAIAKIRRTALYMDLPHPRERDVRGENDFAAMRLTTIIYELYDKLDEETRALVKRFFLERDFTSMYGSENHVFMMRVSRYLAAQFYGEDFKQFNMTSAQVLETDKKYIIDFIRFRAKYGVGEFTSAYLCEDIAMVAMLAQFAKDEDVKNIAQMAVELITIEALHNLDPNGYLAGGAGRTYYFLNAHTSAPCTLKEALVDMEPHDHCPLMLANIEPDDFIIDTYENRKFPMEVFERKHLHSMYAWRADDPDWAHIDKLLKAGSISKYTYLSEKYSLGAICRQDDYPVDDTGDSVYAHHQQAEWSLVIPGETREDSTRVFTSHPGLTDQHRHWTGDLECCCSSAFANKNTVLTVYNVEKEDKLEYTHMYLESEKFDKIVSEPNRLYLKKGDVSVFVYIAKPYHINFADHELISEGRKNAYAFRVEENVDFDEFCAKYREMPVKFDEEKVQLEFDGLFINRNENGKIGEPVSYPYPDMYRSDWVYAPWDKGVIEITNGEKTLVLDFNNIRRSFK